MYEQKRIAALIVAAGTGSRFGAGIPKQYLKIGDVPMVKMAAAAFEKSAFVDDLYVVAAAAHIEDCEKMLADMRKLRAVVAGGDTRQASVYNGLMAMNSPTPDIVLIHDGARPFVSGDLIERTAALTAKSGAVVVCVPAKDTIYVAKNDILEAVPDRETLHAVQTPQGFSRELIVRAHERALADGITATDDGALLRRMGVDVHLVEGDYANVKITTAADLPEETKVGIGFDVHAFAEGRKLILGGMEIPYDRGLLGHSDADVLTHALMDAMLGALSLGDIGGYFPDTDERYRGISSMKLLGEVRALIGRDGWRVSNADMTVVAEKPRMAPHIDAIRGNLAEILDIPMDCVSVKATTTEGLGFTGREEGIGAQAIVQLRK
ncbi:MAG: 2-C-methyl-D-erythritol 4-phosphate cytidylyltransferase [Clostridiales Family XIII bacterium]|jgi:2-C-methyl-D-erythritol 4-phosphate cytidylyltransferase/2-C-methyl-D-erythritol 2,4-cyclodiphosphate synthase|nr:2-C-methyl-D-erythritol 4-phosphate cytidylyltransferase [Clostridiales Family XIII bacterium]